jgi:hypothetical protein
LAVSLAWENVLAYTSSLASVCGEVVTAPAYGKMGMSPEPPAQPVPDMWVRLKPRMRVASYR